MLIFRVIESLLIFLKPHLALLFYHIFSLSMTFPSFNMAVSFFFFFFFFEQRLLYYWHLNVFQIQTIYIFFNFYTFIYLFIYLFIFGCVGSSLLCVGFLQLRRVGATLHRGARASHHRGLSPSRPLLLRSTGSKHAGSVLVAHGPSRSAACGILPDQGSNPCPLHWQADSQPLRHQGSPRLYIF